MAVASDDGSNARPAPLPRPVPPLLSFVAGYVDSITFLALFGFFAAQVTGSFVVAAAELVVDDRGVAAKMLAIPAFMLGAGFAAAIIIARRGTKQILAAAGVRARRPCCWRASLR